MQDTHSKMDKYFFGHLAILILLFAGTPAYSQVISPDDFRRESHEADRFIDEKRYDIAQRILLKLIATHHGRAHEYTNLATCYMSTLPEQQDFVTAEKCALKAIALDPEGGSAYAALADAKLGQDDFAGTITAATKELEVKSPAEAAFYTRARAYASLNKYSEALKDFERYDPVISKWNKSHVNYEEEGRLLLLMGRTDEALKKFRADKVFRFEQATKNIMSCLRKQKKYPEAIAEASALLAHNPKDSDLYSMRGGVKAEAKDWKGAIADYSKAIELSPTETYYRNRAEAYKASGQGALAQKDLASLEKL